MAKKFVHILAARPNFIKAAPVIKELFLRRAKNVIIHTNQHYDYKMSKIFFQDLNIPEPDYHLGVKSGTHAYQTGEALIKIEKILLQTSPDAVIVYGDVNSTLAGALAASKLHIPLYHVESGCRSFDMTMPEEVNRILTDNVSDLLFCTEQSACKNLEEKKFDPNKIKLVGNTAIDSLYPIKDLIFNKKPLLEGKFYLSTLHRPFNVDDPLILNKILTKLNKFDLPVIIPTHPRLEKNLTNSYSNISFIAPLGYIDFINLIFHSSGVISDSGGVQCETCYFRKPLLTLRPTTEHLITLNYGNRLVQNIDTLSPKLFKPKTYNKTPLEWDGKSSQRIVNEILK
tara:strand:+ start:164 stop:1189 length:1026 start_codon:yes stop_codon:yes gene_type:complete